MIAVCVEQKIPYPSAGHAQYDRALFRKDYA